MHFKYPEYPGYYLVVINRFRTQTRSEANLLIHITIT